LPGADSREGRDLKHKKNREESRRRATAREDWWRAAGGANQHANGEHFAGAFWDTVSFFGWFANESAAVIFDGTNPDGCILDVVVAAAPAVVVAAGGNHSLAVTGREPRIVDQADYGNNTRSTHGTTSLTSPTHRAGVLVDKGGVRFTPEVRNGRAPKLDLSKYKRLNLASTGEKDARDVLHLNIFLDDIPVVEGGAIAANYINMPAIPSNHFEEVIGRNVQFGMPREIEPTAREIFRVTKPEGTIRISFTSEYQRVEAALKAAGFVDVEMHKSPTGPHGVLFTARKPTSGHSE
jgi:hypothetical protein